MLKSNNLNGAACAEECAKTTALVKVRQTLIAPSSGVASLRRPKPQPKTLASRRIFGPHQHVKRAGTSARAHPPRVIAPAPSPRPPPPPAGLAGKARWRSPGPAAAAPPAAAPRPSRSRAPPAPLTARKQPASGAAGTTPAIRHVAAPAAAPPFDHQPPATLRCLLSCLQAGRLQGRRW